MNNQSSFIENPVNLNISRSKFNLSHTHSTTFKAGELIPVYTNTLVMPGDTFKVSVADIIRSTTPVAPVMDDAYLDLFWFFVPHKSVLNRESMSNVTGAAAASHSFKAWIGAQDSLMNVPYPTSVTLPKCFIAGELDSGMRCPIAGSLADHFALPVQYSADGTLDIKVVPWGFLSYYSIWNNYFRDPNSQTPVTFTIDNNYDINFVGANGVDSESPYMCDTLTPMFACRNHGYFGSCLPFPQRNSNSVSLPLGTLAPVKTASSSVLSGVQNQVLFKTTGGVLVTTASSLGVNSTGEGILRGSPTGSAIDFFYPSNLYADLTAATAASVNTVRYAFQTQKFYEELARGGNRLCEMTKALFNVTPHDSIDDRPEYLGGKRILLQNHLVANTAGTTESVTTQQSIGSTGAYNLTNDSDYYFTKSFDTWGTLMCLACVRPRESFSQGLNRQWTKFDALDLYSPVFANIGEQPVYKKELYSDGTSADNEVFGYQEAWAEYRFAPDETTGLLRNGHSLAYWTYVNNFTSHPTLAGYLSGENLYKNIDQTLQVQSTSAHLQYMAQFKFIVEAVRPMPTYSIPGLIDHH